MRTILVAAALVALSTLQSRGSDGEPKRGIVGLDLQMGRAEAEKRLKEIGTFESEERKQQQIWKLTDDASFSHVIISFGKDDRLRFVTAVARDDAEAKRIRYADIGDLKQARQAGDVAINNFNYEWELPAAGESPRMLVTLKGRNPEFLETYSIKKLE